MKAEMEGNFNDNKSKQFDAMYEEAARIKKRKADAEATIKTAKDNQVKLDQQRKEQEEAYKNSGIIPTPTPTPQYGDNLGSGTFKSETGVPINLRADWSVKTTSASQVEVTIKVSVDSYAIHLQAVPYAVKLNVNGEYVSMDAPAVDYDGSAATNTVFGSKTFTVNLSSGSSANIPVAVEWHFGGTYGGEQVDVIECGGTISVSR